MVERPDEDTGDGRAQANPHRRSHTRAADLERYAGLFAARTRVMRSSAMRDLMEITARPEVISLAGGLPDTSTFPPESFAAQMTRIAQESSAQALQYGPTEGFIETRECIREVMRAEGMEPDLDDVIVTTGGQQAIDLITKTLVDPGDVVICEAPTYPGAVPVFCSYEAETIQVGMDDDGMRIDELEAVCDRLASEGRRPKFVYTVPSFQNPAGVTMSAERRRRLVALARERELLVVEDNPYGLLRYEGEPNEPLYKLDGGDYVLYIGTFSKILSPGIRLGWLCAPPPVMEKVVLGKQAADLCTSTLTQYFVREYFGEGRWRAYVDDLCEIYRERRDAMLDALDAYFPAGASWSRPGGGLFCWATLPPYIDTTDLLAKALGENVAFVPGAAAYVDGRGGSAMRLNFSASEPDEIREGIRRIGGVIESQVELFESITGEHRLLPAASTEAEPTRERPQRRRAPVPPREAMKVAVLKGGRGLERQVSMRSGARVEDALAALGHDLVSIDVGAELVATLKAERPEVAFIALHGPGGEDGTVQELLEILRIPYTGPGVRACVRSIDKVAAKHELRAAGVPTPDWAAFSELAFRELGAADALEEIEAGLGFPLVVKPASGGSSLGVRFAAGPEEVPEALVAAFSYDDRVLLERHVEGRELAISLINGIALPAVEARPREEDRFTYEARYEIGRTEYVCPADLGAAEGPILDAAMRTWDVLGFDGFGRVDMILGADGPAGAGGERDPRPHRHLPAADGRRGGGPGLRAPVRPPARPRPGACRGRRAARQLAASFRKRVARSAQRRERDRHHVRRDRPQLAVVAKLAVEA